MRSGLIVAEMLPLPPHTKVKREGHWQFPPNMSHARASEKAQRTVWLSKNAGIRRGLQPVEEGNGSELTLPAAALMSHTDLLGRQNLL